MSALWHRVVHRDRDELIKRLRTSSPPPSREFPASDTAQRLKDYLDKGSESDNVLREKRNLLGRARRLTDPQELKRVAKWLRAPVEARPPRNQPVVEALMTASQVHNLAVSMLAITLADNHAVAQVHMMRADEMGTMARKVHDITVWCENLTHQQAADMCTYFRSPEGKRWTRAVMAALAQAWSVEVDPNAKRPLRNSKLERMLAPFVTASRVTPAVVQAAQAQLQPYDVELAELFFWTPSEHEGRRWMLLFSDTLRDMREALGSHGRRSRGSSTSSGT